MERLRHPGGGGQSLGKVPLALSPVTGAPPASVPFFYSSCFCLSFLGVSFCISFSLCVYLVSFSALLFSPCIVSLHLSLSLHLSPFLCCPPPRRHLPPLSLSPSTSLSPLPSLCPSQPGQIGGEAQGRCGLGSLPVAAGAAPDLWLRLLYLGLQLPLIFWLQDTRPGLGQPGPRTREGRARLAGDKSRGAGMYVAPVSLGGWGCRAHLSVCVCTTCVHVSVCDGVYAFAEYD